MNFVKKTIVLKMRDNLNEQNSRAVVILQKSYSGLTARLLLTDFSETKAVTLILCSAGGEIQFALPDFNFGDQQLVFSRDFDIENGVSVYILNKNDEIIAYGACGESKIQFTEIIKKYHEKIYKNSEYQTYIEKETIFNDTASFGRTAYNDDAVAEDNYFKNADVDFKELKICDYDQQKLRSFDENGNSFSFDAKQEKKQTLRHTFTQNETDFFKEQITANGNCGNFGYYDKVKEFLDDIFEKYECENNLQQLITGSKWAKISCGQNKYYVVGLILHGETPSYICYGIPGTYLHQPEILKGISSFIPSSLFGDQNDGYWVMYQDVGTGECVVLHPF